MIQFILRHPVAMFASIVLHLLIVAMITLQWQSDPHKPPHQAETKPGEPESIQAEVKPIEPMKTFAVNPEVVKQQLARIQQQELDRQAQLKLEEQKKQEIIEQAQKQKQELAELQKTQALEKKRLEAEQARIKEIEQQTLKAEQAAKEAEKLA